MTQKINQEVFVNFLFVVTFLKKKTVMIVFYMEEKLSNGGNDPKH